MFEDLGLKNFSIDFNGIGSVVGLVLIGLVVFLFVGGITFMLSMKKANKNVFRYSVPIFTRNHGKLSRTGTDQAKEIFIPDSNISLFFLKSRKTYLARPTRSMGKDEFWYYISENGEWINFDLSSLPGNDVFVQANYDHRDTRYAYTQLKEIIKRNYKDKSVQWWKDPAIINIIGTIIIAILFIGGTIFIISNLGSSVEKIGPYTENMKIVAENLAKAVENAKNLNSGVVHA